MGTVVIGDKRWISAINTLKLVPYRKAWEESSVEQTGQFLRKHGSWEE
jgi:hypothetical protein